MGSTLLRNILKKSLTDVSSCLFLISAVISIYLFELTVVIHEVHWSKLYIFIHALVGTYVFINILGNLFMVMITNTTCRGIILPSLLKPLWTFCFVCEANTPPRSFHCQKCHSCVLKRDHHCIFACCCIGLKNFRYYLVFLFYLALGALYATFLNIFFIWGTLGGISLFSISAHFIPFVFWLFGYLDYVNAFYALMSMLSITGFLFVSNLFILHSRQMLKNQTSYERLQGIDEYNLGWRQNLIESLGSRWHLVWLFPTITSTIPSDGLGYTFSKNFQHSAPKVK